jgi:hypothetical protein
MIKMPRRKQGAQGVAATAAYEAQLTEWCQDIVRLNGRMDIKIGVRDWCYVLENEGSITKGEFDAAEKLITACRKNGNLPLDICAIDNGRPTNHVEYVDNTSVEEEAVWICERVRHAHLGYTPVSFWEHQKFYVEMAVEKIGLHSLFNPICAEFCVAITNLSGWIDINTRAEMMEWFAEWEAKKKVPVLLYCGDHDPDGLRISDTLHKNFEDLSQAIGWRPDKLVVDRFGLDHKFIRQYRLTWIDGLETGAGLRLDDPRHRNHHLDYVQDYLKQFGARKVEANALIVRQAAGRQLCREAILRYVSVSAARKYRRWLRAEQEKVHTAVRRLLNEGTS